MKYFLLFIAIVAEVIATTALKQSESFTKFWPSVVVILGYGVAFYLLSLSLKYFPIGIAYAMWSGVGIVIISVLGIFLFKQKLDLPAAIGMLMIVAGVIIINLFSKMSAH